MLGLIWAPAHTHPASSMCTDVAVARGGDLSTPVSSVCICVCVDSPYCVLYSLADCMHIYTCAYTHICAYIHSHTYFCAFICFYIYFSIPTPAVLSALSCCGRLRPESGLWVSFACGWVSPWCWHALCWGWVSRGKLNLPPDCQGSAAPSAIWEPSPALPFGVNYLLALLMLEGCWWLPAGPSSISTQAPLISKLVSA